MGSSSSQDSVALVLCLRLLRIGYNRYYRGRQSVHTSQRFPPRAQAMGLGTISVMDLNNIEVATELECL